MTTKTNRQINIEHLLRAQRIEASLGAVTSPIAARSVLAFTALCDMSENYLAQCRELCLTMPDDVRECAEGYIALTRAIVESILDRAARP